MTKPDGPPMRHNRLGTSGLQIGEIGLGCMSLGVDEQKAFAIIHEALERGVNFIDTADLYDNGRNEELVGKALAGRRKDVILATKVGNRRIPGQEGWVWDASKAYILSAVKDSLRRLNTDYIDLYQLHGGTMEDNIDDTIDAFEQLRREGVVRAYGISSIRPNVIRTYAEQANIASVMMPYSLLDRRAEEEMLPLLAQAGISVIARGPLAGGALAEGRTPMRAFLDYSVEELIAVRAQLREWTHPSRNLTQLAIRYALSHPAVAVTIPGASSAEQLRSNLTAAVTPSLTREELAELRQITRANQFTQHR